MSDASTARVADLERQLEGLRAELARSREQLDRARAELAAFAGHVSHDLRNPLTSVSMSLQMLREQPSVSVDDEALWMLDRATAGAERLDQMIEALLQYAQVSAPVAPDDVDLAAVVAEVLQDLSSRLRDVAVEVGPLPVVRGDRAWLRVVLRHLLANAATFTRADVPAEVTVAATRSGSGWRVEVADNGPGVPTEDRERVFEPLARRDRGTGGTGLGLATCRRIVEAHGGAIGLAESPAGGVLAWFELPA